MKPAEYLLSRGIRLDSYQLLELYMAMGGVPHYLKQIQKGESVQQAIDRLYFTRGAMLYQSLFKNANQHENIIRVLAKKAIGLSRTEILAACKLTDGGAPPGSSTNWSNQVSSYSISHLIKH